MNKLMLLILAIGMISFTSCDKIDEEFTQFELEYTSQLTIESGFGLNLPINVITPETTTNAESEFEINNTKKDLVEEVTLTDMTLKVTSPDEQRLDFLESIKVYINADGLSELEIAFKNDVPEDVGDSLELDVNENNLKDYIIKDEFSLRVEAVTDMITGNDVDIDIKSTFFVDSKLFEF